MTGLRTLALALAFATSTATDDPILDIRACREKGFDPMRLACPTCDLLPILQEDCRNCCQSYLDAQRRRTHPYQAAVLVKTQQQQRFPTELDALLDDKDEWDPILQKKGGRLQVLTRNVPEPNLLSLYMKYRPPIEVLLLDEALPSGPLSYEKVKEKATEIISLQGLSKDDIKDLLMTLLP